MPPSDPPKPVLIALKVDADTAAALEAVPNRSAFIREALRARLDDLCPLCAGSGRRAGPGLPQRGRRHRHSVPRARCHDCGRETRIVQEIDDGSREALRAEHERLRTFLSFGDFFCPTCYRRSLDCERCGHRIAGRSPAREAHTCAL
ncbi:MAG: hypothetical protein ACYTG6_17440 [Planctomycetota bacterium]|jgi:hypothetical protein